MILMYAEKYTWKANSWKWAAEQRINENIKKIFVPEKRVSGSMENALDIR